MSKYVVVGFFEDNEQPFVEHVPEDKAKDARDAVAVTVENMKERGEDGPLVFVEVLVDGLGTLENETLVRE